MSRGSHDPLSSRKRPLPIGVRPFRDESLWDLMFRAAAENRYPTIGVVCDYIGVTRSAATFTFKDLFDRDDLTEPMATVLGTDRQGIAGRLQTLREDGRIDVFGAALPPQLLYANNRRVSPRGLAKSIYQRNSWNIAPLSFDLDTKEILLEKCPRCHFTLSYLRFPSIVSCGTCAPPDRRKGTKPVDFRDFPQPIAPEPDHPALDFIASLIGTSTIPIGSHNHYLPRELSLHPSGQIFELVVYVARLLETLDRRVIPRKTVDAPEIAEAARVVMAWPSKFADAVMRRTAQQRGPKDKGVVDYNVLPAGPLRDHVAEIVRDARRTYLVARLRSEKPAGMRTKTLLADHSLFSSDIERDVAKARSDPALKKLATVIGVLPHELAASVAGEHLRRPNLAREFADRFEKIGATTEGYSFRTTLHYLIRTFSTAMVPPWGDIFEAILDGKLRHNWMPTDGAYTHRISVENVAMLADILANSKIEGVSNIILSTAEVSEVLGQRPTLVNKLIGANLLTRLPTLENVQAFRHTFISRSEIAHRLEGGIRYSSKIGNCLPHPATDSQYYWREEIEAEFGSGLRSLI